MADAILALYAPLVEEVERLRADLALAWPIARALCRVMSLEHTERWQERMDAGREARDSWRALTPDQRARLLEERA
jgi:hypothetical protein